MKTLTVARTALLSGNDNKALLNYNQLALILKDSSKLAICYNNIGCIYVRLKIKKAPNYFLKSIDLEFQQEKPNDFILACRFFNLGMAYCKLFKA